MTQNTQDSTQKPKRTRRAFILGAALLSVAGGALGASALADSKTAQHLKIAASDGGGWFSGFHHKAHWKRHRRGHFFDMSEEELNSKITRLVRHAAIEIDASPEQQDKIIALIKQAAKELQPLRDEMRAAGKQAHGLLLTDKVDRQALEALRADRLAESDRISKTLVNTIADIAEILSPQQRKLLDERIKEFRSHKRGWHRG